jgi:AraC-like DNA-binding protein
MAKQARAAGRRTHRFDQATPERSGWHAHAGGQFILTETGLSHLQTEAGAWIIPNHRVAWIPPRIRHASRSSAATTGWVVIAPAGWSGQLPRHVCVLRASALMIASLERLTRLRPEERELRRLLWKVVAAEMHEAKPEPLDIAMPSAPRMLQALRRVIDAPHLAEDLDQLAMRAGMSRRSFTRRFRLETGLSFTRWKRAAIAHHALARIANGDTVSAAAFDAGYESVSAFIAMFRRHFGAAPRQYLAASGAHQARHGPPMRDVPHIERIS